MATSSLKLFAGRKWFCLLAGIVLVRPACGQEYLFKVEDQEYDWSRNLRLGALMGMNIKGSFKMNAGSYVVKNSGGTGIYDDGYVIPDTQAGDDRTANWGYDSGSQYNSANHTLTMHRTTSFSTDGDGVKGKDSFSLGFELAYGGNLWKRDRLRVGWDFGFGLSPIEITDSKPMDVTANRSVFTFDTSSIWVMPHAGYRGTSDSSQNYISSTNTPAGADTVPGEVTGSRTLDVILFNFRLGPSLYFDLSEHWAVAASAGGALGLVSGEYRYNETLTLSDSSVSYNKGKIGMSEVVFGGYVNAMVLYHAEDAGDLYLGVQYMPMGDASVSSKGRQATLDLSGQVQITAGVNWSF